MSLGYQPDLPDSGAHALQSLDPDGALLMLDSEALALRKGIAPRMPKPFNSNVEKKDIRASYCSLVANPHMVISGMRMFLE